MLYDLLSDLIHVLECECFYRKIEMAAGKTDGTMFITVISLYVVQSNEHQGH